jgi:hypothetical protein
MKWVWPSDRIWIAVAGEDKGPPMEHVAAWQAHVYLFGHDSMTQARVVLDTGANRLTGEGLAR